MRKRQKAAAYMLVAMLTAASIPTQTIVQAKESAQASVLNETKNTEETEKQSVEKPEETTTEAKKESEKEEQTTSQESTQSTAEESTDTAEATQETEDSFSEPEETTDKKDNSSKNEKDQNSTEKELTAKDSTSGEETTQAEGPVDYSMPTEISEGYTAFQLKKTEEFALEKKEIHKNIKALKQVIPVYQEQIKKIGQLYIYIENTMEDGETLDTYLIGTSRIKANAKKLTTIDGLDAKLAQTAAAVSSDALTAWLESYTLEQTYVPTDLDLESSVIEEVSNVMPVLSDVVAEKKEAIQSINAAIAKNKEQRKELNKKIKQNKTKRIFNPNDVTLLSGITKAEARQILKNTNMEYLAQTFVDCEKTYHVNAIFLMAVAAHESDWGRSRRAVEDHNYTGYGIHDGVTLTSGEECIQVTTNALATNYLNPVGKYYSGTAVCDVHKKYCATGGWSNYVVNTAYKMMESIYRPTL